MSGRREDRPPSLPPRPIAVSPAESSPGGRSSEHPLTQSAIPALLESLADSQENAARDLTGHERAERKRVASDARTDLKLDALLNASFYRGGAASLSISAKGLRRIAEQLRNEERDGLRAVTE